MLFLFGRSISPSLADYFTKRSKEDGHQVVFASMGEFGDTEPFAELEFDPKNQLCVVFQSVTKAGGFAASSHFMQMCAVADDLKREGAGPIWAMNPMAPFMRQDKIREGRRESLMSNLAARFMEESGFVGLSTVEAHSQDALNHYKAALGNDNVLDLNPNQLFADAIERLDLEVTSVANPDLGSDTRGEDLAQMLGAGRFSIDKERNKEGTTITGHHGTVTKKTAMIDDIASSLGTAKNGIELISEQGSQENILLISHAIMSGNAWDNLAKLIRKGSLERVLFLPTIARDEEFVRFKQQYGPTVADKVVFLHDEYNAMIYSHVTETIANHPAMAMEVA